MPSPRPSFAATRRRPSAGWVPALLLAAVGPAVAAPAKAPVAVELAPYMSELQTLTHKLSLSVAHGNGELADFYLYESLELLEEVKEQVPEYRGLPVALLIDRMLTPSYQRLGGALESGLTPATQGDTATALGAVISSCNACHQATRHGFIRIIDRGDFNPFNQDFRPQQ